jgi:hypothetical protein
LPVYPVRREKLRLALSLGPSGPQRTSSTFAVLTWSLLAILAFDDANAELEDRLNRQGSPRRAHVKAPDCILRSDNVIPVVFVINCINTSNFTSSIISTPHVSPFGAPPRLRRVRVPGDTNLAGLVEPHLRMSIRRMRACGVRSSSTSHSTNPAIRLLH